MLQEEKKKKKKERKCKEEKKVELKTHCMQCLLKFTSEKSPFITRSMLFL